MPSTTFFRLPEEKRSRLVKEAWREFSRAPLSDASINRIILGARIPRGSFYQYFVDKNDLFLFLLDKIRDKFLVLFDDAVEQVNGDMFALPEFLFTQLIDEDGTVTARFAQGFKLLSLNLNMDIQHLFFARAESELLPRLLSGRIDTSNLRSSELKFVGCTFSLLISTLGEAIAQTLMHGAPRDEQLEQLRLRVDIIKNGSVKGECK